VQKVHADSPMLPAQGYLLREGARYPGGSVQDTMSLVPSIPRHGSLDTLDWVGYCRGGGCKPLGGGVAMSLRQELLD
jgi:hypothetical protein